MHLYASVSAYQPGLQDLSSKIHDLTMANKYAVASIPRANILPIALEGRYRPIYKKKARESGSLAFFVLYGAYFSPLASRL